MRACEGCRRRKIKCDAATTNTWPCSACVRLKLHCVRPNGFEGSSSADPQIYEPAQTQFDTSQVHDGLRQQLPLQEQTLLSGASKSANPLYASQSTYPDASALYQQSVHYPDSSALPQNLHYTTVPPPMNALDQTFSHASFPTPPLQQQSPPESPPDAYTQDAYGQQDLADLLGSLKVNEAGTGE